METGSTCLDVAPAMRALASLACQLMQQLAQQTQQPLPEVGASTDQKLQWMYNAIGSDLTLLP